MWKIKSYVVVSHLFLVYVEDKIIYRGKPSPCLPGLRLRRKVDRWRSHRTTKATSSTAREVPRARYIPTKKLGVILTRDRPFWRDVPSSYSCFYSESDNGHGKYTNHFFSFRPRLPRFFQPEDYYRSNKHDWVKSDKSVSCSWWRLAWARCAESIN